MCNKAQNSFRMGYDPEFDTRPALHPEVASYFQSIIGILRWTGELGRIYTMS